MARAAAKKTASETVTRVRPELVPLASGRGALLTGGVTGNRGGTGRPPNVIRAGLREKIPAEVAKLEKHVREIEKLAAEFDAIHPAPDGPPNWDDVKGVEDERLRIGRRIGMQERVMAARQQLLDYRAKYGLGTTITETDTEGRDTVGTITRRLVRADGTVAPPGGAVGDN